jgi:hypothetical protein
MKRFVLFLLILLALALPYLASAQVPTPQALSGAEALPAFFQGATGYAPDAEFFGVYVIEPVGDSLYLGFGTARPAEYDGALIARLDGNGLTALAPLDEQGFVDMTVADDGRIYIPGADPTDDWSMGNIYIHDPTSGQTTKLRTLPNTIHAWKVRKAADGRLLVTVGRYLPEQGGWPYAGGILASEDGGLTWTVAADDTALGLHRTYDLVQGPTQDVALVDDASIDGCQIATRSADGAWVRRAAWTTCRMRLASDPAGRRVVAVGVDARSLIVAGSGQRIGLPFTVQVWAYHWWALVGRTLYVVSSDNRVMATRDLRTWTEVARFERPLVSIAYWPARNALVVATRGTAGGLFTVPLAQ